MTVATRSAMWALIILSALTALTTAQKACSNDGDCMSNQFCYSSSLTCVNYTVCAWYNREESAKPAREPSQCGKCLKGYSPELLIESSEADSCKKGHDDKEQGNTATKNWVIGGSVFVAFLFLIGILYAVHVVLRCKFCCEENPAADREPEKPGLLMVENGPYASAPPPPSPIQNRNNNKYDDAEETNPLSSAQNYRCTFMDECRPVKAQGFHPPDYVRTDPTYNPGDSQTVQQPMFPSPPDIDEETIPSEWTPGPSASGGTLPVQPFAAIAEEVQDNTTNTALQRLTCPSPSTSQDGHENRQNNNSGGTPGGFNSNTNGNARANPNPPSFVQVQQTVNIFHHGNNGR